MTCILMNYYLPLDVNVYYMYGVVEMIECVKTDIYVLIVWAALLRI